jgi:hypothetical protein
MHSINFRAIARKTKIRYIVNKELERESCKTQLIQKKTEKGKWSKSNSNNNQQ